MFSFVVGRDYDDSNFVFGAEWVDQAEAFQSDVPWEFMQDSYYIFPAGCELQGPLNCTPIWSSRIPETGNLTDAIPATALTGAIPAGIGCLSSMMAIGGGIMSVKTLRAFNEPMHRAVSAAALSGLAISVPGTLGFMLTGAGDPLLRAAGLGYVNFALISPATILLAPLGARIAPGPSQRRLTVLFGLFLHVAAADTPGASSRRTKNKPFQA